MKISALISTLLIAAVNVQAYSDTYMVCLVNRERAQAGLSPLGLDSALTTAAQRHSDDMAARNNMDHTGSDGSSPGDRCQAAGFQWTAVAENIAYGQTDADDVMRVWMDSPGHRENILNGQYTMMGSAVSSGGSTPYYTQNFACDSGPARNVPTCDGTEQAAAPSTGKQTDTQSGDYGTQTGGTQTGGSQSGGSGGKKRSGRRGSGGRSKGQGQMMSYGGSDTNSNNSYGSTDSSNGGGYGGNDDNQWFSSQGFGQRPSMNGGSRRSGGRAHGSHPYGGGPSFGGGMMSGGSRGNRMMSDGGFGSFGRSMGGGMGSFAPLGTQGGGYY